MKILSFLPEGPLFAIFRCLANFFLKFLAKIPQKYLKKCALVRGFDCNHFYSRSSPESKVTVKKPQKNMVFWTSFGLIVRMRVVIFFYSTDLNSQ